MTFLNFSQLPKSVLCPNFGITCIMCIFGIKVVLDYYFEIKKIVKIKIYIIEELMTNI